MSLKLGVIGTGSLGGAIANRLLDGGYELTVFDTNRQAMAPLEAKGAKVARGPREVADNAEMVIAALPSPEICREVAIGKEGIVHGRSIKTYVEMSSVGRTMMMDIAQGLAKSGIDLLDCPVSGGTPGAREGTLAIMVAGDPRVLERCRPVFSILGKEIFHIANEPGLAQLAKAVNNIVSAAARVATYEAVVTAVKGGIDARTMIDIMNAGSARNVTTVEKFPAAILNRSFKWGGHLSNGLKDTKMFLDEAEALGVKLWVTPNILAMFKDAEKAGYGEGDSSRVYRFVEESAGIKPDEEDAKVPLKQSS